MIGTITTKEELLNVREENGRKLSELEIQLSNLKEEVDFLIKYPKNRIFRMKQPKNLSELKIPENVKVISIPEIRERINSFFRKYNLLKTDVNHLYSARLEFDLTTEEDEKLHEQKRRSDRIQTLMNEIDKKFKEIEIWLDSVPDAEEGEELDEEFKKEMNEIDKWIDSLPNSEEVVFHPDDGGMTQIDPPSLQLDTGPADTSIDSVVDDLCGIVVLC